MFNLLQFLKDPAVFYALDLTGTLAFAVTGAISIVRSRKPGQEGSPVWLILAGALFPAVGGGTVRSLLLGVRPFWFAQPEYIVAGLLGGLLVTHCASRWKNNISSAFERFWEWGDALGVGVFAALGAQVAYDHHLPMHVAVFFAALTTVFGGWLKDAIVLARVPGCCQGSRGGQAYLCVALIAGVIYCLLRTCGLEVSECALITTFSGMALRVATRTELFFAPAWSAAAAEALRATRRFVALSRRGTTGTSQYKSAVTSTLNTERGK